MTDSIDRFWMDVALDLAQRGVGRTSPNPAVGCVVVRGGRIVGRGWHPAAGRPHAEVFALEEAGAQARGAEVYVTLEPCSHHGRTPPCVERLIAARPRRVVAAMTDPNPAVAGRGLEGLRQAGIDTVVGVCESRARRLNEAFTLSVVARRAFVHLKLASTLDGRIATRTGDSRWVSGPESRDRVHRLRDRCGAVLVGAGTARADDPRLTVRLPGEPERRTLRVVLASDYRLPDDLFLCRREEAPHTLLVGADDAPQARRAPWEARGVQTLPVRRTRAGLDLTQVLEALYGMGVMEVLVEGGAQTARRFLDARLVDRLHLFLSPRLLGGQDGVPMVGGVGPAQMDDALSVADLEVERVGADLYLTGVPHGRPQTDDGSAVPGPR